jgi:serine/threonine protein kinase/roadblock/LC7 domain-containing protein
MGEVYRATDTKLKRQVAIKILPPVFAADHDRLARFQREAEVLASLNHPHIAGIYGLEESGGITALVMELVEGEDLSQRIARGAIPIDEALPIAKQIAEALEAAHEQGIIHRDLKPQNIKVRPDGTVKVLDFGLAKAMEPAAGSSPSVSMSPTLSLHATQAGVILGTAAYMAPEQAKGRAVDRRADIWAFGAILYEMLSGTRAFEGDDVSDLLANVLKTESDWSRLPAEVPARVRHVIRACLQKNAKQRIGDMQDVRLALEGAFETAASQPVVSLPPLAPRRPLTWIAAFAVAFVAAVALSIPAVRYLRQTPPPETRVDIVTPATGQPSSFALSPDARQIVFVASDDKASRLWLRSLSTTTAQPLAGTDGATFPFWSPDSKSVGFFAGAALKRLDLGGGAPQILAPVTNGVGGTWNTDGVIVFAPSSTGPLMRVPATGGASVAVTTLGPQQFGHVNPQFLPDGRRLLFGVFGAADVIGIYLGGLDGSASTRLGAFLSSGVYAPGGWLLWVREGTLTAQKLDVGRSALTGEPVTLADGLAPGSATARIAVSVAATGLVAYRTEGGAQRQLTWFDRSGTARGVVGEPDGSLIQPRVSPDGRRVAVVRRVQDNQDLWLLDGARATRLTFDPSQELYPVWSPDSTQVVYLSRRTGIGALFHKLTNGAGMEEQFLSTDQSLTATSWSEDGRFLLYISIDPKTNADLWVMPMSGNAEARKPFVFLKTPFREAYGTFSPDGRWVAYHSNESGRPEIYVRPFVPPSRDASADRPAGTNAGTTTTAAGGQWQVSTTGGILPLWRSDGKELYYLNTDGAMMAAPIKVNGATVEPGAPVMLFPTRIFGGGADIQLGRQYDVTPDGRFLVNTLLNEAATPITLLQNWNPDAKR